MHSFSNSSQTVGISPEFNMAHAGLILPYVQPPGLFILNSVRKINGSLPHGLTNLPMCLPH